MNKLRFAILGLAILVAAASSVRAQSQYIGYVYPAGGQQGTTFPIRLGGQGLVYASDLVVSGEGVSVRLVDYYRVMDNQELAFLSQQLNELQKKESTLGDVMAAKMASFEFPAPSARLDQRGPFLICPVCGTANPPDASVAQMQCEAGEPKDQNRAKGEERTSQVREGSGQGEADRTDPKEVRGRRAQSGRSFPNRTRLCRGHGGSPTQNRAGERSG